MSSTTRPVIVDFPSELAALGTEGRPFEPVADLADLPPGALLRVSRGDLDLLIAHTERGLVATDDRCPHMSAPLSLGRLEGCVVQCPLHRGRFDLANGETVQFPTTGGLDPEGQHVSPWTPAGAIPKPEVADLKASARAMTRVRRLRYYPIRITGERLEVAWPRVPGEG